MKYAKCPHCKGLTLIKSSSCPDCKNVVLSSQWRTIELQPLPLPENIQKIELLGNLGPSLPIRKQNKPISVGKHSLALASSESRFASRNQFIFTWREDRCFLCIGSDTQANVLINGKSITQEHLINQGDRISLQGRSSMKLALHLIAIYS